MKKPTYYIIKSVDGLLLNEDFANRTFSLMVTVGTIYTGYKQMKRALDDARGYYDQRRSDISLEFVALNQVL